MAFPIPTTETTAAFNELQLSLETLRLAHRFTPHPFRDTIGPCGPVNDNAAGVDKSNAKKRSLTTNRETVVENLLVVTPPTSPIIDVSVSLGAEVETANRSLLAPDPVNVVDFPQPAKKRRTARRSSCRLPTANNPIDESFCMNLYSPDDEGNINPFHIEIRKNVLEVRRTKAGEIFFQCACCKHLLREVGARAKQSVLAPQRLENLYHAFIRFMMDHVPACKHIPQEIKDLNPRATQNLRSKKYWVASAIKKGLRNGGDGKGIIYQEP
mmetsp:Transcript_38873/g.81331  ORF Transcript_38873/g.81331 Transcript_38873/m.81331 type:complete len:269 (-) Transcript_38873:379-1185(-)